MRLITSPLDEALLENCVRIDMYVVPQSKAAVEAK
jgi:hypothetical protein